MAAPLDYFGNAVRVSAGLQRSIGDPYLSNAGVATGSSYNDGFVVTPGHTLAGGLGDDQYWQVTSSTKIVEKPNEGIDTVYVISNYVMPDNVENMVIQYARGVVGNDLNNYIVGSSIGQTIDGGAGNDTMTGNGGGDTYIFDANSGYDAVTDFHPGKASSATANPDAVELAGYSQFKSFGDVMAAMSQVGSDVILKLSDNSAIKFENTKIGAFTSDNFLLANAPASGTLTFDDEFNSLSLRDSKTGTGTWRTDYTWGGNTDALLSRTLGPFNGEKEIYVDPTMKGQGKTALGLNPFSVTDGVLDIHAALTPVADQTALYGYKYTSGLLSTKDSFTQTYGYFEASMEIPQGQGLWPAFWLYGAGSSKNPELDVMENLGGNEAVFTSHSFATGTASVTASTAFEPTLTQGFHKYGLLWTSDTITWYLDGVAVKSIPTPADMHQPMYMIVNLAIDKSIDPSIASADLKVDYIHAYSLDSLPSYLQSAAGSALTTTTSTAVTSMPVVHTDPGTTSTTTTPAVSTTTVVDTHATGTTTSTTSATTGTTSVTTGSQSSATSTSATSSSPDKTTAATDTHTSGTSTSTTSSSADPSAVTDTHATGTAMSTTGTVTDAHATGSTTSTTGTSVDTNTVHPLVLTGTSGNDTYTVADSSTVIKEAVGAGTDSVKSSADYVLPANVENLTLTGHALTGTGNDLNNGITGNDLDNTLIGGGGSDNLFGGKGADTMIGGTGNDTYWVDNVGDKVAEKAGEGTDSVYSYVDYTLPANVERLYMMGSAVHGTGNELNNVIVGNGQNNIISGGAGNDMIDGGAGDDVIIGGPGNDNLTGGTGNDTFVLERGGGNDTITDFKPGEDKVDWSAFTGMTPTIKDMSDRVIVSFGADTVTLMGVHTTDLNHYHVFGG